MQQFQRSGFTLIELSIVLVIIGLVVGGVLTGRDLIRGAEARKTIQEMANFNAATLTFRNKYVDLPGDIGQKAATAFGFTASCGAVVPYGNQNGYVEADDVEEYNFWHDLGQAKLLAFTDTCGGGGGISLGATTPKAAISGQGGYYVSGIHTSSALGWGAGGGYANISSGTYYFIFASKNDGDNPSSMSPLDAYMLDSKTDDGLPFSGKVQAGPSVIITDVYVGGNPSSAGAAGSNNCVNNAVAPNIYNAKSNGIQCSLLLQTAF